MDPHFSKEIIVKETTEPSAPDAGYVYVYAKSDGLLYSKDDAGVETAMGGGSNSLYAERSYYEGGTLSSETFHFMVARTAMTITRIDAEVSSTPYNPPTVGIYKNGTRIGSAITIDGGPNSYGNRHKSISVNASVAAGDRLELSIEDAGDYQTVDYATGPLIIGLEFTRA